MLGGDFAGMSDREILIAVATRQESTSKEFLKFQDTQAKADDRLRNLELNGSKLSQDLSIALIAVDKRLASTEGENDICLNKIYDSNANQKLVAEATVKLTERVNYLEVNGAKVSQQTVKDLAIVEKRLSEVEIHGSEVTRENTQKIDELVNHGSATVQVTGEKVKGLEDRIVAIENTCNMDKAVTTAVTTTKKSIYDSIWVRAGMLIGMAGGIIAMVKFIWGLIPT